MRSSTVAAVLLSQVSIGFAAAVATTAAPSPTYTDCSTLTASTFIAKSTATSGCKGSAHTDLAGKGSTWVTINNGDTDRNFVLHVPSNYNKATKTGLVLNFHGSGKNACIQEKLTLFSNETYNPDWIVAYPQGLGNSWYGPTYHKSTNSDFSFVSGILSTLRAEFCIDDAHIYATGKSNGGGFVGTLACHPTLSDEFAAFAPVSGAFYTNPNATSPCAPARSPLPIAEFHGADDCQIPYDIAGADACKVAHNSSGIIGEGGPLPTIPDWLDWWGQRNCKNAVKTTVTPSAYGGQVEKTKYTCGDVDDVVAGYKIANWQHWWPTTDPNGNADSKGHSTTIGTTAVVGYLKRWTKPAKP